MKTFKIKIIGILSSIILLISCTDKGCGGVLNIADIIMNNTDYNLKIKIWGNFHLSNLKGENILNINKNSEINRNFEFQNLIITNSDSLLITFGNKKMLLLKGNSNFSNRIQVNNDNCIEYNTYNFTNEDYANAEDCNGNCE